MNVFKKENFPNVPMRTKNKSGIILIVVLWIIVILSMLAIGLSRNTRIEIQLTKHGLAALKARYAAMSGIFYAIRQIEADSQTAATSISDTKYQCGFSLEAPDTPADLFKDVALSPGVRFSIFYAPEGDGKRRYGLTDEESRINVNALGPGDYGILKNLLILSGVDNDTAETIAASAVDWRDEDDEVVDEPYGAEENFYARLENPYSCKNAFFENPKELLLVRGMTPEIFDRVKESVTVFPYQGRLLINFDTASNDVLRALARHYAGAKTNTEMADADSLVEKILFYRRGDDGMEATADDRPVDFKEISFNAKEKVIALSMQRHQTKVSRYLRIRSRGTETQTQARHDIEAVVDRSDVSVLYWRSR